jgi:Ca2+-binding EF-hand superfamily protein
MEVGEFASTLASLGKPNIDRDLLKRLMAEHDKDESGTIDASEFSMIMGNKMT